MNKLIIIPVITLVFLLIDWYVWQAVKISTQNLAQNTQNIIKYIFWGVTFFTLAGMWVYNFVNPDLLGKNLRTIIMVGVFVNYVSKIFVILFLILNNEWFESGHVYIIAKKIDIVRPVELKH